MHDKVKLDLAYYVQVMLLKIKQILSKIVKLKTFYKYIIFLNDVYLDLAWLG